MNFEKESVPGTPVSAKEFLENRPRPLNSLPTPQATGPFEFQVTLLVRVEANNEAHGRKLVENGISTALGVSVESKDIDLVSYPNS